MYRRWPFKYTAAAVIAAILIIAASFLTSPFPSIPTASAANFAVLLTDPPTVPAGTTQLNLTYSGFALHVFYPDESAAWLPVEASGTVNLFSLINVTKTIATTTIPVGTKLDRVQFTISNVTAEVKGTAYNVTTLADTFVVNVLNGEVNQTLSGVLVDFNPTLVQIQASDENGTKIDYYVLVPSASAMIVRDLEREHVKVGTVVQIGENNKVRIKKIIEELSKDVTIVSAKLKVNGNNTSLSVTLENSGDLAFKIFGLTLHGEFTSTRYERTRSYNEDDLEEETNEKTHFQTIPFKIDDSALVPLLGDKNGDDNDEFKNGYRYSSMTIKPGERITLSFDGVIDYNNKSDGHGKYDKKKVTVLTPVVDGSYTVKIVGQGSQTIKVQAELG